MASESQDEFTVLLAGLRQGKTGAVNRVVSLAYQELRRLAAYYMRQERTNHTLQATALVHEAYARLCGGEIPEFKDKAHFFAVAAQQMRRILVDHARDRQAAKRGGNKQVRLSLDDVMELGDRLNEDVIAVDLVLSRLESLDPRAARVVELKYYGGLTDDETAEVLGVGVSTIKRDWDFARSWLMTRLKSGGPKS